MATPGNEPKTPGGDPTTFTASPTLWDTPEEGPSQPKLTAKKIQEFVRANFHELDHLLQNSRQDDRGKEPMDPKEKRRTSFPDPRQLFSDEKETPSKGHYTVSSSSSGHGDEESVSQRNRSPAHRVVRMPSSEESAQIEPQTYKILIDAFINGLRHGRYYTEFMADPLDTFKEVLKRVNKYAQGEEANQKRRDESQSA
ncbi:OLC1v1015738C1 [Oldenlandia corymbosa var. corymbosa]|uniref:OLC1v1015738C1 n=1 Tax=Oldenlandia corymbosa var. corymbosa TaxID=529605 RepID=A0AAV1E475_OLDCO|nr:OLC1v1015738C1 [Oldenlandia corymbosa var. corymbosa]